MSSFLRLLSALLVLLTLLCGCNKTPEPIVASGVTFLMDTWVEQRWYGDQAQQSYEETIAILTDLESRLSLYKEGSEIAALNAAAGTAPIAVSEDTFLLLQRALLLAEESDGLFDITIAPLTLCWDITGESPTVPSSKEIATAKALVNYRDLVLDEQNQTAMLTREGMQIDLGGIAKGMAASAVAEYLANQPIEGYLSIGGNMLVQGKKPDGSDFFIGIRDPRGEPEQLLGAVLMDGLIMATTGDYERYFEQDGIRYHHVLDPMTGYPSASDLISVTVMAKDGALADCLSTSVFLQGSRGLADYLERDDCLVMAVTEDRQVYASKGFWERFTQEPTRTDYTFHREGGL